MPGPSYRPAAFRRLVLAVATTAVAGGLALGAGSAAGTGGSLAALPPADCGPGSRLEPGIVGRVPARHFESGRAAKGYSCNAKLVGHTGASAGFKVERYQDAAGRVCAFYDVSRMFPTNVFTQGVEGAGVDVLDMTDPAEPRRTSKLTTPAMLSPHESLSLNRKRGLLAAVMGNAGTLPGMLDVYDVSDNCRKPTLLSSTPMGILGHESGFAPDGRTYYASSLLADTITAVDLSDPTRPATVTTFPGGWSHGVRVSPDGNTLYVADMGYPDDNSYTSGGLKIYDVSAIQDREPLPQAQLLSTFTWSDVAVPQVPEPMRIDGHDYLLMVDEFTAMANDAFFQYRPESAPAVARIINVDDPEKPFQVSALRLEVHLEENRRGPQQNDPGATNPIGGYASHYCGLPRYRNPELVACAYINSGMRVFDISNPARPREVAYFNRPAEGGGYAMAKPAFDRRRHQVWFTDVNTGFFAVRLTNGVWPDGL